MDLIIGFLEITPRTRNQTRLEINLAKSWKQQDSDRITPSDRSVSVYPNKYKFYDNQKIKL